MTLLKFTLFGSPTISIDSTPVFARVDKLTALLALLAIEGPTLDRGALIDSLWTRKEPSKARAALRTALWRLRGSPLSPWLEINGEFIHLKTDHSLWVDVAEFQKNLAVFRSHQHDSDHTCPDCFPLLHQAAQLYQGDFMAGYSPRQADGFVIWRAYLADLLHQEYLLILDRLVKGLFQQGQYDPALHFTQRWLAIDPYNEEAHTMSINCYANNGQRGKAIAHYRAYKRLVEQKLDTHPSQEITALYKHILKGSPQSSVSTKALTHPALILIDIPKFSHLWSRHGILMEHAVDRLVKILSAEIINYGGRLIKQAGDRFGVLFDHGQPIMFAIAIQHLVSTTKWSLPDPLPIRMVITTLPDRHSRHLERAPELASCRQLLQAASENQVLLTEQAARNFDFPPASQTQYLGSYLLPDQINPLQVYQLLHPNLSEPHKAGLHNLVHSPVNLPLQATRFIGRETELNQLTELLSRPECRLLTLLGPGGVGKTRLGIQVLSLLQSALPDGIFFIPLAMHQDPATLYKPIADALNLEFNNPGDQGTHLIEYIQEKRMLLFLDNFEHLLEASHFLGDLLEAAPGLRILLTSRQSTKLYLETPFEVKGLPYPQDPGDPYFEEYTAIQLFIQNAQRVFPGFELRQEEKPHILQICTQVEGLPLGIELASAWVRALSCGEIANSIKSNLEFLQTSNLDVPPRHRSLHAAFDYSWKLLSEEDRRTLAKLSIFSNGFSPQAADQLANATPLMLAIYVDKYLLTRQSADRYLMPDTLRAYVLRNIKNSAQDYEHLLNAHCDYYLNYLYEMFYLIAGETGASVLKKLWLDVDNIRHALFRAIDLQNWPLLLQSINPIMLIFEIQGRFREGYEYANAIMHRISVHIETEYPDIYYAFLGWVGSFNFRSGSTIEGLEKMRARVEYARQHGDIMNTLVTLTMLADAHRRLGELPSALQEINQSLGIMESLPTSNDNMFLGVYGHALAILAAIQADLDQIQDAHQTIERCKAVMERSRTRYNRIRLLDAQSRLVTYEMKYTEAIKLRLEALAIAEDFNDRRNIVGIKNNLGASYLHLGDHQTAWNYLTQADQLCDEIGHPQVSAALNTNLGYLTLQYKHDPAAALNHYEKSLSCYREIVNPRGLFNTLRDISRAYLMVGRISKAHACIIEALHLGIELDEPQLVLHLLTIISRLLIQMDRCERAAQLCRLALSHPQTNDDHRQEAQTLLSEIWAQFGIPAIQDSSALEPILPSFHTLLAEISDSLPSPPG
jgi:predicted ATPase/DNA-binding SARP family transcriptional activator